MRLARKARDLNALPLRDRQGTEEGFSPTVAVSLWHVSMKVERLVLGSWKHRARPLVRRCRSKQRATGKNCRVRKCWW